MNAILISQSGSLRMFHDLALSLKSDVDLSKVGMIVSHRREFKKYKTHHPKNKLNEFTLLPEWEITNDHENIKVDFQLLAKYEKTLGVTSFQKALLADRRITQGAKCTYFQDYQARYTYYEQLQILQNTLIQVERLFDQIKPDFVISFICVTLTEYIANLFAKSRGIKVLNIRPTRIQNYMAFGNDIIEPSNLIHNKYQEMTDTDDPIPFLDQAEEIYTETQKSNYNYEGTSLRQSSSLISRLRRIMLKVLHSVKIFKLITTSLQIQYGHLRDNHDPGIFIPFYYETIYKPLLRFQLDLIYRKKYVRIEDLTLYDYVFFPLHTEPEKALLIDAPFYTNQIEVIRNISYSLPTGTKLIVKDHPKSYGKRPITYYQKILDIPNVHLVDPFLPTAELVKQSSLVITVSGSVGWESILRETPVITLGNTPYEFLPDTLVTKVSYWEDLPELIQKMISNYRSDKKAVLKYISACISESVPLNYYSTLLNRSNINNRFSDQSNWESEITKLHEYTKRCLAN